LPTFKETGFTVNGRKPFHIIHSLIYVELILSSISKNTNYFVWIKEFSLLTNVRTFGGEKGLEVY
jgi:hypothetical protein